MRALGGRPKKNDPITQDTFSGVIVPVAQIPTQLTQEIELCRLRVVLHVRGSYRRPAMGNPGSGLSVAVGGDRDGYVQQKG